MNCHFWMSKIIEHHLVHPSIYEDTSPLSVICEIFSPTLVCLSTFLQVSFDEEKFKTLMSYKLSVLFFVAFFCPWNEWGWGQHPEVLCVEGAGAGAFPCCSVVKAIKCITKDAAVSKTECTCSSFGLPHQDVCPLEEGSRGNSKRQKNHNVLFSLIPSRVWGVPSPGVGLLLFL